MDWKRTTNNQLFDPISVETRKPWVLNVTHWNIPVYVQNIESVESQVGCIYIYKYNTVYPVKPRCWDPSLSSIKWMIVQYTTVQNTMTKILHQFMVLHSLPTGLISTWARDAWSFKTYIHHNLQSNYIIPSLFELGRNSICRGSSVFPISPRFHLWKTLGAFAQKREALDLTNMVPNSLAGHFSPPPLLMPISKPWKNQKSLAKCDLLLFCPEKMFDLQQDPTVMVF